MAEQKANGFGFISLDRSILQWRWFTVPNTAHLFVFLILRANHEDRDFMGITVHRGELVTSLQNIASQTGIKINQVRTALKHLKSTGEITSTSTNRYTLISIVNYDHYQSRITNRATNKAQTKHKQITNKAQQTTMYNNENNENNLCVTQTPSLAEAEAFFLDHGRSAADAGKFHAYNSARGWKIGRTRIEDWRSAAEMWIAQDADVAGGQDEQLDDFGRPVRKEFE